MSAFVIDAFDFCRQKEHRTGEIPVASLSRLAAEMIDGAGAIRWELVGGADPRGNPRLRLAISGTVELRCQRCLKGFPFEIDSESTLVLAANEGSADELDAMLADEEVEVIVGSKEMDVTVLIEDEALLALPLAPKHEICPGQLLPEARIDEKKESPFAVLKKLKH